MRFLSRIRDSEIWSRQFTIDLEPVRRWVRDRPEAVVLGGGVVLRLIVYLTNRAMWLDELSLLGNLINKPILDFSQPLAGDQLAPLGFLIVQRALAKLLGHSNAVMRLVPLAAGIAALYLFASLVRRVLARRPALIALILFAFSDDLIYYSSEMKPYSVDLAVGLVISPAALDTLVHPVSLRTKLVLALAAAVAPWCSFSSAFIVAGCGTTLILTHLRHARFRIALAWVLLGIAWLANFLAAYTLSRRLLSPYTTMYLFWDFAFLPLRPWPIRTHDLHKTVGILLEILVNPLNLVAPIWPYAGAILPLVLLVVGGASLARRSEATCLMLAAPIALAIVASALERYPFHGRLILELVPGLLILIAEGTAWLQRRDPSRHKLVYKVILVLLLAYPSASAIYHATGVRLRGFNAHGDLHNNLFIK
jgi:hypothetical protein